MGINPVINSQIVTVELNEPVAGDPDECTIENLAEGQKAKIDLEIRWHSTGSDPLLFTHTAKGSLLANAE